MPPYAYEEVLRDAERYDAGVFSDYLAFEQQQAAADDLPPADST